MAHQHHVVVVVDGVVLGEAAAGPEQVEDLHRLRVLDLVLAGDRHAAGGEQRAAEDDRGDEVFVRMTGDRVEEVGERAEASALHQVVERQRGACGPRQFGVGAAVRDLEHLSELRHARGDRVAGEVAAQRVEFVGLHVLDVAAEGRELRGEVALNVEHAVVGVAHHAEPVVRHAVGDAGGVDPVVHLAPALGVVLQRAADLVEGDAAALEDVGDLGHRAGGAGGQPLAGHRGAVAHRVEGRVVDGPLGLEVQHDDRHARPPHDRQHRVRERVGGDVQEDQVDVGGAEVVAGVERSLGRVDEAEVHDLHARAAELLLDAAEVAAEAFFQPVELGPVGLQSDAKEAELEGAGGGGGGRRGGGGHGREAEGVKQRAKSGRVDGGGKRSRASASSLETAASGRVEWR